MAYAEDAAMSAGAALEVREIEGDGAQAYLDRADDATEAGQQIAPARVYFCFTAM